MKTRFSFASMLLRAGVLAALAMMWSTPRAAETLRIVTEELPPYNFTENGRITGLSTEVVEAVLKEIGVEASIHSMPWARAYDMAQNTENVLIYSITRTPAREKLFKWVGIVAPTDWYLFSLKSREVKLRRLDDARPYQIATVNEDAGEQYLVGKGFVIGRNLQQSNRYEANYEKLRLGRVDLWVANELNALYLARRAGDDPNKVLVRALHIADMSAEPGLSMAFGPKTSDALVQRFRSGLEAIKKNGTYDMIRKKWL
jgi:polar amino acid transport system substrate-binding protein